MTDLTDEEHDDIQKNLAVQHIRRGFVEPGDLEILGMAEAEVEEIWQQQARERAKPPVDPATGYDHEPAPGDYRAPDYPPEPNFGSFTTMNTPHGYEGWPLDNPADFADLVTEAADSLHFLFTFFPTYANQRSCLANTLILLNNIANGIRATPARHHAETRHEAETAPAHRNVHTACPACGGGRCRVYSTEDQANAASDHAVIVQSFEQQAAHQGCGCDQMWRCPGCGSYKHQVDHDGTTAWWACINPKCEYDK